jgi:hypothetical protein
MSTQLQDDDTNDFFNDLMNLPDVIKSTPAVVSQSNTPTVYTKPITPAVPALSVSTSGMSPEEIQAYVLSQCQEIIGSTNETLECLKPNIINTCDGKAINGYATLVGNIGKMLEVANSVAAERMKVRSAKELEALKHENKRELQSTKEPDVKNQLNIIATREEVINMVKNALSPPIDPI